MENHGHTTGAEGMRSPMSSASSAPDVLGAEMDRAFDDLRGRIDEAAEQAAQFIRARPGTSLLVAIGVGYLIGRLVRA